MPQTPEFFNDESLYALIDTANEEALEQMKSEHIQELARNTLWKAIEEHDLPITVCRYEENKDELLDKLVDIIIEQDHFAGQTFETPDERYNTAVEIAEGYWNIEEIILERLVVCIELQLTEQPQDPGTPKPDGTARKKRFMADLIAEGTMTEMYYDLANIVLDGNPLDLENDTDIDICVAALDELNNIDGTPRRQLYYKLRETLGVPLDGLLPGSKYSEEVVTVFVQLNDAAEEIQLATALYPGFKHTGARHKEISEIMTEFSLTNPAVRNTIFAITDAYNEEDLQ